MYHDMLITISCPHTLHRDAGAASGNTESLTHQRALNPGKHCPCGASALLMADRGVCCGRYSAARAASYACAAVEGWLGTCLATHAGTRGRHGGQECLLACQPGNMQHEAALAGVYLAPIKYLTTLKCSQLPHVACLARANSLARKACSLACVGTCWANGPQTGWAKNDEEQAFRLQACALVQAQGCSNRLFYHYSTSIRANNKQ